MLTLQVVLPLTNVYVNVIYLEIYPKASSFAGSAQCIICTRQLDFAEEVRD